MAIGLGALILAGLASGVATGGTNIIAQHLAGRERRRTGKLDRAFQREMAQRQREAQAMLLEKTNKQTAELGRQRRRERLDEQELAAVSQALLGQLTHGGGSPMGMMTTAALQAPSSLAEAASLSRSLGL